MDIEQKIYKATLLLDLKSDVVRAETLLREAVAQAHAHGDAIQYVRASMFLGELLVELGRSDEALPFLRSVANSGLSAEMDLDVITAEVDRAKALLRSLQGNADPTEA